MFEIDSDGSSGDKKSFRALINNTNTMSALSSGNDVSFINPIDNRRYTYIYGYVVLIVFKH